MTKKIFFSRRLPGNAEKMLLEKGFEVTVNPKERPLSKKELLKELKYGQYDGVVCLLHDDIDSSVFEAAPSVKIFSNYAVGYNNIDVAEAKKRGVSVTNTPSDSVNESVAEHTFALILALSSRIVEGDTLIRKGKYTGWDPNLLIGEDLKGRTLGVIGAGRIGSNVIQKATMSFRMKVIYHDVVKNEKIEKDCGAVYKNSVEEVLKEADVITLHVNLDDKTKHLINRERLSLMKKEAFIVNTARGAVIDEEVLYEFLKEGKIKGAGLDVFEHEPKITKGLSKLSNVVLTPHIASATLECRNDMSRLAAEAIIDFFDDKKPANLVA